MHAPFDLLSKGVIDATLSPYCPVSLQEPVVSDALYADAVVDPPDDLRPLRALGLLGRMAMEPCAFVAF